MQEGTAQAIVFCKEVLIMCNLSQGVKAEGREEGKKEGICCIRGFRCVDGYAGQNAGNISG